MPKLTITFDNGPTAGITDKVLDVLSEYNIKATFFMVGKNLLSPLGFELALRVKQEGHWIGNHTFSHSTPLGLVNETGKARNEIESMHKLLGSLVHENNLFRPNGRGKLGPHLLNKEAIDYIIESGTTVVLWTSVPLDRKVDVETADAWLTQAKEDILKNDWTLMVLHDRPSGHEGRQPMDFLSDFLRWARDSNIEILQSFPPSCIPISNGKIVLSLKHISTQNSAC